MNLRQSFPGQFITISPAELSALCQERNQILFRLRKGTDDYDNDLERLFEINQYLSSCRIISTSEIRNDSIGFGTSFVVSDLFGDTNYVFTEGTLASTEFLSYMDYSTYGSLNVNDYVDLPEQNGLKLVGKITSIQREMDTLIIKDIGDFSSRISREASKANAVLRKDSVAYDRHYSLTPSQLMLLQNNYATLLANPRDCSMVSKLGYVTTLLKSDVVRFLSEGESIGFGSLVNLEVTDKKRNRSRRFVGEYIAKAASYETIDNYIEWISNMGYRLFGLKAGDSFEFRKAGNLYSVKVLGVNNTYPRQIKNGAVTGRSIEAFQYIKRF